MKGSGTQTNRKIAMADANSDEILQVIKFQSQEFEDLPHIISQLLRIYSQRFEELSNE